MGRTRIASDRSKAYLQSLYERKANSEKRKRELIRYIERLKEKYNADEISYARYVEIIHHKRNGRTIEEWIHYFHLEALNCYREIQSIERSLRSKKIITVLLMSFFLIALVSLISNSQSIVGFFTQDSSPSQDFSVKNFHDNLNEPFIENSIYEWNLENTGRLNSVKLSGSVEGEGEVKVYLNDLLILDSSNIQESITRSITAFAVESEESNSDIIEEEVPQEDSSPSQEEPSQSETSNSENEEEVPQEDSSPSQEDPLSSPETSNSDIIEEEVPQEDSSPSQEEPSQSETINESLPEEMIEETNQTVNESNSDIIEEEVPQEDSSPSQEEPSQSETRIRFFEEHCDETCFISNLNLTNESYKLRIEVNNATLNLDTVDYQLIFEGVVENVTEEVVVGNETQIVITEIVSNATVKTIQHPAVIGEPVRWTKEIKLDKEGAVKVNVPREAKNITAYRINKGQSRTRSISSLEESREGVSLTGMAISNPSDDSVIARFFRRVFGAITGRAISEDIEIVIEDNASDYEVEYFTEAPLAVEENITGGKRVTITGPDKFHYQNILAFVNLSEESNNFKLYHIENGKRAEVQFNGYDNNGNGLIDYIEWGVPHLSTQVYEIIIEITKAEHLNSKREFISEIYDQVFDLDNIWSGEIKNNEYVRVTFEANLTSGKDIAIYPRVVKGRPGIEVYEKDGNEIIAEFDLIVDNEYNKVYLDGLNGSQDTFDLRVVGGSIEFDHIVDPFFETTSLFLDGFEINNFASLWTYDAAVYERQSVENNLDGGGTFSIQALGASTHSTMEVTLPQDISGYSYCNLTSRLLIETAVDAGEYLCMDYSYDNGTTWNRDTTTDGGVGGLCQDGNVDTEDVFRTITHNIDNPGNNQTFKFRFRYLTGQKNENAHIDNVNLSCTTVSIISLTDYYALNSSSGRIDVFNTSNIIPIENVVLNFSIDSNQGDINSWYLNFTANGTNGCSLGNKQSSVCYSYPNWIQFINGTNTATYNGEGGDVGDRIIETKTGTGSSINLSYIIDEHYNPNIFKWYDALYNFSDIKWQNGTGQRIVGSNLLKIELNNSLVPTDADSYKLDFRVGYGGSPTNDLEAYVCNSSYVAGDSVTSGKCAVIASKLPSEFQGDGTKYRGIFTGDLLSLIGDMKWVILVTAETNASNYYYIKSYGATAPSYTTHWEYSPNYGATWFNLADGYETELNVNWFYGDPDPTTFVYKLWVNTTTGFEETYEGNITWDIDPSFNIPPEATITAPSEGLTFAFPKEVIFVASDPNADDLNVSLFLYNTDWTLNKTIVTNMTQLNNTYIWDDSTPAGSYKLVLEACEINTTELYCINSSRSITLEFDTTYPQFSNYVDNNGTVEAGGIGYFNVTVDNTNGTVYLEIDGKNITATNTSNVYNVTYTMPEYGTYPYRWHSWGNGTAENYNVSAEQSYYVNKSEGPAVIKKVQHGYEEMTGLSWVVALDEPVIEGKSFLTFSYSTNLQDPGVYLVKGELNSTHLIFSRDSGGGTISIAWYVVEFESGVNVQSNTDNQTLATTNILLDEVNISSTFPLVSFKNNGGVVTNDDGIAISITNSTNVQLRSGQPIGSGGSDDGAFWQAIDYGGAKIQNGSFANWATTTQEVTINEVDLTKTFAYATYGTGLTNQNKVMLNFTNSTNLHFERNGTSNINYIDWYVVEFTGNESVQTGQANFVNGVGEINVPISEINTSTAMAFIGSNQKSGKTNDTRDDVGAAWFVANITNSTNLQLTRSTAENISDVQWFIVDFAGDITYPQFSNYADDNGTLYDSGTGYFNVTVLNTNGTVYLEINGTNVTATNVAGDNYTANYTFSTNDTYTYRWHSWGNGSLENYNVSEDRNYTVLANTAPTHNNPILNSTDGSNDTNQNLTCYNQSTFDADGHDVKNVFNWYLNGLSFNSLNMPFEGGSNSTWTRDYSGNDFHGTVYNTTWNRTGGYDGKGAYEFDGNNSYISTQNFLSNANDFSFGGWFYANEIVIGTSLWGQDGTFECGWNGACGGGLNCWGQGIDPLCCEVNVSAGQWYHLMTNWNGTNLIMYLNGSEEVACSLTNPTNSAFPLNLGGNVFNQADNHFNGTIDDFAVYNKSLSAEQIKAIYDYSPNVILSADTIIGENWRCEVTPNDGYVDGTTLSSDNLTVLSSDFTPPQIQLISPDNDSSDLDGIVIYQYNVTDAESAVASCEFIVDGSVWSVDNSIVEGVVSEFRSGLLSGVHNWNINCTSDGGENSSEVRIINISSDIIFEDSFTSSGGFENDSLNSAPWERGNATQSVIGGCLDDAFCWGTNLTGNYNGTASYTSNLTQISGMDLSGYANATMWFNHYRHFEDSITLWDGGVVELSYDGGASWERLTPIEGYTGNQSNNPDSFIYNQDAYGLYSDYWELASFDLTPYVGNSSVKIRFIFAADTSSSDAGWFIDTLRVTGSAYPTITLITPPNNAVDPDGTVYFNCSANDSFLVNVSLYINGVLNDTIIAGDVSNFTANFSVPLADGTYNWSCGAWNSGNFNQSGNWTVVVNTTANPIYNATVFNGNTLNWSNVADITNVCDAVLDNVDNGQIQWLDCVNAHSSNFDVNVNLSYNNITVVSENLNETFNASAVLTLRNLTWDATPLVYRNGALCPEAICTNATYNVSTGIATFNVTQFTSYSTVGNAQLEIWDENDTGMLYGDQIKYTGEQVKFFANYTKKTNNDPITGATCFINFTDSSGLMTYNATDSIYEYNRSFSTDGTFDWNVTCTAAGFQTITLTDNVSIALAIDDLYPQFSDYYDDNGTLYNSGTGFFAVNVDNTNGTVYLEINGTNTSSYLDTYLVPVVNVTGHNNQENFGGNMNDLISFSGMNVSDKDHPSDWRAIVNNYWFEWQSGAILNTSTSINNKTGWMSLDFGETVDNLDKIYIWNVRETSNRAVINYSVYYATNITDSLPVAPTGTSIVDYNFSSDGWTKLNGDDLVMPSAGSSPAPADAVVNLSNVSARYIAIEIITHGGDTARVGLAEVAITKLRHEVNYTFTQSGTYPYRWHSWGNGTSEFYNVSIDRNYTVLSNAVPIHNNPILNSTDGSNETDQNLTCYNQSTSDSDGNPVKNIYNWNIDGVPRPVLNMPFEGGSNSTWTRDYSGNANNGNVYFRYWNGTDYPGMWTSTGGHDGFGAYDLTPGETGTYTGDDWGDYIELGSSLNPYLGDGGTVIAWVKVTATGDNTCTNAPSIIGDNNMQWGCLDASGGIGVNYNGGNSPAVSDPINDGEWHHVALVLNESGDSYTYIDGTLNASGSESITVVSSTLTNIGSTEGARNGQWDGLIDDLMVFDEALTAEQIAALYNTNNLIVSQETSIGENWTCEVTPNDGYDDGTTLASNYLVIVDNTAPNVTLDKPEDNYSNDTDQYVNLTFNATVTNQALANCSLWTNYSGTWELNQSQNVTGTNNVTEFNLTGLTNKTFIWNIECTDTSGNSNFSVANRTVILNWTNTVPTHNNPILNSTDGSNETDQNLTCYNQSTNDADGHSVKNIFNWYKDGTSLQVLNMPFEGGSNLTFTKDYSGTANGTVSGATWNSTAGYDGKGAYEFDGTGDYIEFSDSVIPDSGNFSISLWFNPSGGNGTILDASLGTKYFYISYSETRIRWDFEGATDNDEQITYLTAVNPGTWYHLVAVGRWGASFPNGAELYLDGSSVAVDGNNNGVTTGKPSLNPIRLGQTYGIINPYGNYSGTIDDVQIFNHSLSDEQISALYNNRTDLIVSQELGETENNWSCEVTPNDGYDDGTSLMSNNLTTISTVYPTITLITPPDNAVDPDGTVYFNCSANDSSIANVSLYINGVLNDTIIAGDVSNFTANFSVPLANGTYNWSCGAWNYGNFNQSGNWTIVVNTTANPIYNATVFNGNTTNWSNVVDITNVCDAVLDRVNVSQIEWVNCVNAHSSNFDVNVNLSYNNITVLSENLNETFNTSAILTLRNLTWDATPLVYRNGALCPEAICTNATYNVSTGIATFNVTQFTSYTTQGNSQMTIWDENDTGVLYGDQIKYVDEQVKFFANYTKKTDGSAIIGATCTIYYYDGSNDTMSYNTTDSIYEANRTFSTNGTFDWNVTCTAAGFQTLTTADNVSIALGDDYYPQFSNYFDNNASLAGARTASFGVTLNNTNGTVLLEINGTNVSAVNLWTPSELTTVAWFDVMDADTISLSGSSVISIEDKSGNGNNATGVNSPTYNSIDPRLNNLPTIGYDQAKKYLEFGPANTTQVYVVTYYDDPDNTFDSYRSLVSEDGTTNIPRLQGRSGANYLDYSAVGIEGNYRNGNNTALNDASVLPMPPTLLRTKWDQSYNVTWRIMGGKQNYHYWEYGAVGEVIFTDGTEDLATQQKMEGYLAWKWGLVESLDASHPYKYTAPVSDGSSDIYVANHTFGSTNTYVYPYKWHAWSTGGSKYNVSETRDFYLLPEYPQFYDYVDDSVTLTNNGTGYFNITVNITTEAVLNGTVLLEINGTNITATNVAGDLYTANYTFTSPGGYDYRWHAWSELDVYNVSEDNYYVVVDGNLEGQLQLLDLYANGGLNPYTGLPWQEGDTYRFAFNTNATTYANETGLDYYNTFVQNVAYAGIPNLTGTTWKVIGSNGTIDARDNTNINIVTNATPTIDGAFFLIDGTTIIANNISDLWDGGTQDQYIDIDEDGNAVTNDLVVGDGWAAWEGVWTGTEINGVKDPTDYLGSATPNVGLSLGGYTGVNAWISRGTDGNTDVAYRLYGMSDVLTIQFIDEDAPNVTLDYPEDNYYNDTDQYVNLTFNATVTNYELANCSLWTNYSGTWELNQTQNVTGTSNVTEFNLTELTNKTFIWNIECTDTSGNSNFSVANRTVILNGTDDIYPIFSNYWDNNATLNDAGVGYFNVTVLNSNGTVLLEINGENITATNWAGNNYSANYTFVSGGVYPYRWHSWGNGTNENYNVSETRDYYVNITGNTAPTVTYVSPIANVNPIEAGVANVTFYATINDSDGTSDIDTVAANFTRAGEPTRTNLSCVNISDITSTSGNYSCTIQMYYFDEAGNWNITVWANDSVGQTGINTSTWFQYNQLSAIVIDPSNLNFTVNSGAINQSAINNPMTINNTGNANLTENIGINSTNLLGELVPTDYLPVENFSVSVNNDCAGTTLQNATQVNITGVVLERGNLSAGQGQEQLYYCITEVGTVTAQTYSTQGAGSWLIKIVLSLVVISTKKRRKKRKLIIDDLSIPASVFETKLGALEALTKYLKENLGLTYSEIAELLNRDDRTIWTAYNKSLKKQKVKIMIRANMAFIPTSIFKNRNLTILEAIVVYLKEKGMKYVEIGDLLNRDQRNIWTIYSRSIKKEQKK